VIYEDTRDIKLSKEWWRSKITKELGKLTRNSEIEKGELI
jgi:hypothetical protein